MEKEEITDSFWYKFDSLRPVEVRKDRNRDYFTAPYTSNIRSKFNQYIYRSFYPFTLLNKLNTKRFERFFDKNENKRIATKDRCLLAYEILSRTTYSRLLREPAIFSGNENDRNIGIDRLLAEGAFLAAYPLHESFGKENSQKTDRQV